MSYRFLTIFLFTFVSINAQQKMKKHRAKLPPKLVISIVVDQMRYDYLSRFYNQYSEGGFKKLLEKGFSCNNHHVDYVPTTTAPGHASIYTGTTPRFHGIIGNSWYDRKKKEKIYCVFDSSVSPVGTGSTDGKMSPSKLKVTTIGDQNRIDTQMRGKSISVAMKERGAVLSGGHTANAAYWFRGKNQGSWISSSYYLKKLPKWVIQFNESDIIENYFNEWNTFYNKNSYTESGADQTGFERGFKGKDKADFPYDLNTLKDFNGFYDIIRQTPFGNSFTIDFGIEAVKEEKLGKDNFTDFLMISLSSTDYIGHNFGVNSKEIEDTYIRLDKDLERLINNLDSLVGKNEYVLFLTADHGATHVPDFLISNKIPAGYFKEATVHLGLRNHIRNIYKNDSIIEHISNNQVFLDHSVIEKDAINAEQIEKDIVNYLIKVKDVHEVYTRSQLENLDYRSGMAAKIKKGFNSKRSGDVIYVLNPAVVAYSKTGSTHGSGYTYDTHVPLLFYGKGIKQGKTYQKTTVTDIAPTIANLLGISFPNSTTGNILYQIID
ncbi:alkaline phosphatase PafA [Aquimarina sp. SS2-1]|uniref:alkaline phosphatase PafA n=1 Tax=Aquimarina besae TaxID=3342247 RepID=UPI00366F4C21